LPNNGASVTWLTPPEIVAALGRFDLDPCCPENMPWRTAEDMITEQTDGLSINWYGRVWLNPPYGTGIKAWLSRLADHGNGIALVPARTEVENWFWPLIWERANAVFFFRGRLFFRTIDGKRLGNAGHGSVLAAYGQRNVDAIENSGLDGKLIRLANA
jgi:hypothetical protein